MAIIQRKDFETVTPQAGDFVGGVRTGATPREDVKYPIGELPYVKLNTSRIAMQEKEFDDLQIGWNTVAFSDAAINNGFSAVLKVTSNDNVFALRVGFRESSLVKSTKNTKLKILDDSTFDVNGVLSYITKARLCKSDSVNGSGIKVQVYVNQVIPKATVGIYENISRVISSKGLQIVTSTPIVEASPTLPDGVTSATFIEAGAELSLNARGATAYTPNIACRKSTNDILNVVVDWTQVPKQGTGLSISLPSSSLAVVDGSGSTALITGAHTISNFTLNGNSVEFSINETGAFASLIDTPLNLRIAGSGFKLTITG